MKSLLLFALLLTSFSSAFAGILENRRTGETIEFILNRADREIEILSTASNVENNIIHLSRIKEGSSNISFFNGLKWGVRNVGDAPPVVVIFPVLAAYDAAAVILKAPAKLLRNIIYARDFKKLMNAINSTDVVRVSHNRFRRIESLLNYNQNR